MPEDWKPNRGQRIDALYAWVVEEPDGGEGIAGAEIPGLGFVPLVVADMARIASLRQWAERVRKQTGYPVRLVRYATREAIEELP
jgi:hypothetical protein